MTDNQLLNELVKPRGCDHRWDMVRSMVADSSYPDQRVEYITEFECSRCGEGIRQLTYKFLPINSRRF